MDPEAKADEKEKIYKDWKNFLDEWKARPETPEGLKDAKIYGTIQLAFAPSEREFLRGAVSGMLIAIVFAFVIFMLATQNLIQALLSVLCVAFIVTTVVSVMVFQGWQLGISESVGVVILIGFSVDYVVHLSSHYIHSA